MRKLALLVPFCIAGLVLAGVFESAPITSNIADPQFRTQDGKAIRPRTTDAGVLIVTSSANTGGTTTETLVLTSATAMPCTSGRTGVEYQNLGPNPIYCAFSSGTAVVNKARRLEAAGGTWSIDATGSVCIWCIADVTSQLTGAATISSEVR